jgi:hypothetical protein
VKDENGHLLADSHNHFSQFLNVHRVSDVKQIEIHTAELLVTDPSPFNVKIAIAKLKRYKLPDSDQILAEMIQTGGTTLKSEIRKLINSIWNKEELPDQWKVAIIVSIYKKGDETDCSNYHGISMLSILYKILSNIFFSSLCLYVDEITGDHQSGFQCNRSTADQIFAFVRYWREMEVQ